MCLYLGFWNLFLHAIVALGWLSFLVSGLLAQSWKLHLRGYDNVCSFNATHSFPLSMQLCVVSIKNSEFKMKNTFNAYYIFVFILSEKVVFIW
jgi:hypothetical protein